MINKQKKIDVILLCGGQGKRLRPLTRNTPKPLLIVNKKPFLFYIISNFLKLNVDKIILAAGYKVNKIKKFKKTFFKNNKKIKIINSGEVDIIKRIKDASHLIKNDFFLCYGDTYIKLDLNEYLNKFYKKKDINGIVSGAFYQLKFGVMQIKKKDDMIVCKFKEKPIIDNPINLGYFFFKNKVLRDINKSKSWLNFLNNLAKKRKLSVLITNKEYFTFDSPREYNEIKTTFV
jgi:NDP-sugar pyrophosphorylase family protein